jgi:soluble lytic murein transglycosylase-like protein
MPLSNQKSRCLAGFAAIGLLLGATPASAELVFFATGRTLSVKGHRVDGESLVLMLRAGGEIVCEPSLIARIEPDEVPYPEPEPAVEASATLAPAELAQPYSELIDTLSARHGVDPRLVKAIIRVESAYQERARSRKGAMGLMQLMPDTARQYAVRDPYEPRSNIEAGIRHLSSLLEHFTVPLALAAYNAGEAAVRRFGGVPPYPETRDYVGRVLRLSGQ